MLFDLATVLMRSTPMGLRVRGMIQGLGAMETQIRVRSLVPKEHLSKAVSMALS